MERNNQSYQCKDLIKLFFTKVLEKVIENLVQIIIGAVIALISLVVFFARVQIQDYFSDINNISKEYAYQTARGLLGPEISDVIPFRNRDNKKQYIVVSKSEIDDNFISSEIFLLEGSKTLYEIKSTGIETFSEKGLKKISVIDVDKDGYKELVSISYHLNSYGYEIILLVFSTFDYEVYSSSISANFGDTPKYEEKATNGKNSEIPVWMSIEASNVATQFVRSDSKLPSYIWDRENGKGFNSGKVKKNIIKGYFPNEVTITCQLSRGDVQWISLFKGPIFQNNARSGEAYIVYNPIVDINYINSMILGKKYLWFGIIIDDGILVYNVGEESLSVIRINNIDEIKKQTGYDSTEYTGVISIEGNSLYFAPKTNTNNKIKVKLFHKEFYADEFTDSSTCLKQPE